MTRWRYHSLMIRDLSIADSKLNVEGERGWELVSMCLVDANTARAYFKMPVDENAPDPLLHQEAAVLHSVPGG